MAEVETVQVIGLSEADRALSLLPEALRRNTILAALRRAVRPMTADARARAPKQANPERRGGQRLGSFLAAKWKLNRSLAQSIKARALRARDPHLVEISVGYGRGHFYGRFQELGTTRSEPRSIKRGPRRGKTKRGHTGLPARPFLGPAFIAHQQEIVETVGVEIGRSVERTAEKLARQAATGKLSKTARRALGGS